MFKNVITATLTVGLCCSNLANATLEENYITDTLPDRYINNIINNIDIPPVNINYLKIQQFYDKYDGVLSYDFLSYIDTVLKEEGIADKVSLPMMIALIDVESKFDHNRESSVGAYGLCQIMPGTAASINKLYKRDLDRMDDYDNVRLSVIYLKDLYMRYKYTEAVIRFYNGGSLWRKKPATKVYYNVIMRKCNAIKEALRT